MKAIEPTLHWPGHKSSGRRAKDFQKCEDRTCSINKAHAEWNAKRRRSGMDDIPQEPHCHPIF